MTRLGKWRRKEERTRGGIKGEGQGALPAQGDQRKLKTHPGLEGHQNTQKPKDPEVRQGPEEIEYKKQGREEGEERERATREERAPEQSTDRDVAKPPHEENQDKLNSNGRGCGITFGGSPSVPPGRKIP